MMKSSSLAGTVLSGDPHASIEGLSHMDDEGLSSHTDDRGLSSHTDNVNAILLAHADDGKFHKISVFSSKITLNARLLRPIHTFPA